MNNNLINLARHNFNALQDLSALLRKRGYWTAGHTIEADTSRTVHDLFGTLVWADRSLHIDECWMLDALLEEDQSRGGHLREAISKNPAPESGAFRVPGCVAAAALHDSVHHTRFRELIVNHLENLGMLFVMADAHAAVEELDGFHAYFAQLRKIGAAPSPERVP